MGSITLSEKDTSTYEADGPDAEAFRKTVNALAQTMADSTGKLCEVYSSGDTGYVLAAFEPTALEVER